MEKDLKKELARLESLYDQLSTEMSEIDRLLKRVGFSEGLKSIKQTAEDLVRGHPEEE